MAHSAKKDPAAGGCRVTRFCPSLAAPRGWGVTQQRKVITRRAYALRSRLLRWVCPQHVCRNKNMTVPAHGRRISWFSTTVAVLLGSGPFERDAAFHGGTRTRGDAPGIRRNVHHCAADPSRAIVSVLSTPTPPFTAFARP